MPGGPIGDPTYGLADPAIILEDSTFADSVIAERIGPEYDDDGVISRCLKWHSSQAAAASKQLSLQVVDADKDKQSSTPRKANSTDIHKPKPSVKKQEGAKKMEQKFQRGQRIRWLFIFNFQVERLSQK